MALDPKAQTSLTLPYVAQVTGAWATPDSGVLAATHPLHVWTEAFIETRWARAGAGLDGMQRGRVGGGTCVTRWARAAGCGASAVRMSGGGQGPGGVTLWAL